MKVSSSTAVLIIVLVGVGAFGVKTILHRKAVSNSRKEFTEADILSKQGKMPEALAAMRKAVDDDPTFIDAREGLADMLINDNKMNDAVAVLDQGAIDDPMNKSKYYYDISEDYKLNKDYDKAVEYVKKSIAAKPGDAQASKTLPFLLESAKRYDEAQTEWLNFEKQYPQDTSGPRAIKRLERLRAAQTAGAAAPAPKAGASITKAGDAPTKTEAPAVNSTKPGDPTTKDSTPAAAKK